MPTLRLDVDGGRTVAQKRCLVLSMHRRTGARSISRFSSLQKELPHHVQTLHQGFTACDCGADRAHSRRRRSRRSHLGQRPAVPRAQAVRVGGCRAHGPVDHRRQCDRDRQGRAAARHVPGRNRQPRRQRGDRAVRHEHHGDPRRGPPAARLRRPRRPPLRRGRTDRAGVRRRRRRAGDRTEQGRVRPRTRRLEAGTQTARHQGGSRPRRSEEHQDVLVGPALNPGRGSMPRSRPLSTRACRRSAPPRPGRRATTARG